MPRFRSRRLLIAVSTAGGLVAVSALAAASATAGGASLPGTADRVAVTSIRLATPPTGIAAAAGEVYDVTAGKQLWGKGAGTARPIASITKVMTAYVAISAGTLGRKITITAAEAGWGGSGVSKAGLYAGEVLTTRQMLYAMLLPSGADAAAALATTYGPGPAAFVKKMNTAAKKLGLTKTTYADFVGLYGDMSTPQDLLKLAKAAMKLPAFPAIVDTRTYSLSAVNGHRAHTWTNRNLLIGSYKYAIGIKTGWTPAAGECLLFMASYKSTPTATSRVLVGVVLHSSPLNNGISFRDATRLLNWAYGLKIASPVVTRGPAGPD